MSWFKHNPILNLKFQREKRKKEAQEKAVAKKAQDKKDQELEKVKALLAEKEKEEELAKMRQQLKDKEKEEEERKKKEAEESEESEKKERKKSRKKEKLLKDEKEKTKAEEDKEDGDSEGEDGKIKKKRSIRKKKLSCSSLDQVMVPRISVVEGEDDSKPKSSKSIKRTRSKSIKKPALSSSSSSGDSSSSSNDSDSEANKPHNDIAATAQPSSSLLFSSSSSSEVFGWSSSAVWLNEGEEDGSSLFPAAGVDDAEVVDDDEGVDVGVKNDTASSINALTIRHRGGFSLSTFSFSSPSSNFIPILFRLYIIQLYAFVLQFVGGGGWMESWWLEVPCFSVW